MKTYSIKDHTHTETKPDNRFRTGSLVAFIIGLLLAALTAYIAHKHRLTGIQASVFHAINNENLPAAFTTIAKWATEGLGAGYAIAVCVVVPLLFKKFKLAWRFLFVAAGAGVVADLILKPLIKEPRPIVMLGQAHLHARVVETDLGYPSGHATEATALAMVLWFILPARWRWLSVLWILIVMWSRLYLGVHSPVDVLGGFAIGLMAAMFVRLLPNSIAKPLRLDIDDKNPIQ